MSFEQAMRERIASGLQRKSLSKASRWATACRVMDTGKWSFLYRPWLVGMHDSEYEINVGQKAAQVGYTELLLNLVLYTMDVKHKDCLYVLPSKVPDAANFSAGRFNKALESSPYLSTFFDDVQNVGHKIAGGANLYIRGSRSKSQLKSVPVSFIALDEVDEMDQKNIALALERASGQESWQAWMVSTPTLPEVGINKYFNDSTQNHFMFKCPSCSRMTELIFPECVEIIGEDQRDPRIVESYYKCKECSAKLNHEEKHIWLANAEWVPTYAQRNIAGWHVNQLYSHVMPAEKIAKSYFLSLRDPSDEQELYNSKLGVPHAVSGSQLNEQDLSNHMGSYSNGKIKPKHLITMGVDVGKYLHCEIDEWILNGQVGADFNTDATCRAIFIGKFLHFSDLDYLMQFWGVHSCVIDANPMMRDCLQFANRFYGHVRLCIYGAGINGKEVSASKTQEHMVLVDRTSWLDLSLNRFRREGMIEIPIDTPIDYKDQLKVPARLYKKDRDGNQVGYYESSGRPDHYAHARNYSEIALKFAATMQKNVNIRV